MHPHLLENGLIGYLRWEYQERHFHDVHSVWTVRPDGTMSDALFKQHLGRPSSVRDARSIPGTGKLVAIAAGHHTLPKGPIVLLNPAAGVNNQAAIELLTHGSAPQERSETWRGPNTWEQQPVADGGVVVAGGFYMMPFAVSEKTFLASYAYGNREARRYTFGPLDRMSDVDSNGLGLYLLDAYGNNELIYRDPIYSIYSAIPMQRRERTAIPDATDPSVNFATCVISDIYQGMTGVERGSIKYIRISEALPWPIVPGEGVKRWPASNRWCPVRVIGTVPVESDGSAHFKVPTADNASVYFQALDENRMEIRRMRSSISFQPGERRGCTGCHETDTVAPKNAQGLASTRPAVMPTAPPWGVDRPLGFEWLVQPILDEHCTKCHAGKKLDGGIDLAPGRAYQSIIKGRLVSLSSPTSDGAVTPVKAFGSHKSKLITTLLAGHDGHEDVKLPPAQWEALVSWVDANAPYQDRMQSKRTADGRSWVWEHYPWQDPWAMPQQIPAKGRYLEVSKNKWTKALEAK